MRNTKIALAVLALVASTAAMADSTMYGTLEAAVVNTTYSGNTTNGSFFSGSGGWVGGNNIGFKGSEEIDSNLKATYQLEAGLTLSNGNSDNGGSTGPFTRFATIGLSSNSWGTVTAGQHLSPYIISQAVGTAGNGHFFVNRIIMGGGAGGAALGNNAAGGTTGAAGGFFIPNAVQWTTPANSAGISATLLTSMRNSNVANGAGANQGISNNNPDQSYQAGMLNGAIWNDVTITLGFQNRQETYRSYTGSASYTFSPEVTLYGNYTQHKNEGSANTVNSYSGSVAYKLSAPLTLTAQYASNNLEVSQSISSFGAQYSLSKRTSAYAMYGRGTNGAMASYDNRGGYTAGATTTSASSTAVGLVHSF